MKSADINLADLSRGWAVFTKPYFLCNLWMYCDQAFVSETTRCSSIDFIEINDKLRTKCCALLCVKNKEGKRANYWKDRERECARERTYETEG